MNILVKKSDIQGNIRVIPSKSYAHRILILSALGNSTVTVNNLIYSKDILATINALVSLGAKIDLLGDSVKVEPIVVDSEQKSVFCDESGSTLRFLLPIISALGLTATVDGKQGLRNRPIKLLLDILREHGVIVSADSLPLTLSGKLKAGTFVIDGSQSSQNLTGLMIALSLLDEPSEIIIKNGLVSVGYIDITLEVMKLFGANIVKTEEGFIVNPATFSVQDNISVEGDYSSASFLLALGALCGDIAISGLKLDSNQGDRAIVDILAKMGADISAGDTITVKKSNLKAIDIVATDIPDLIPIIAVCCSRAKGVSSIKGVDRLKIKESDRLLAVCDMLTDFGVIHYYAKDTLYIYGGTQKAPTRPIKGYNDHRIVMSASVMAVALGQGEITDCEAISKSYPNFFEDLKVLGGDEIAQVLG